MRKFNGVPREHFPLFLKECEWRFNNPKPQAQLTQLKQWVKEVLASYLGQPLLVLFVIWRIAQMG